jgi:alpha-1,3-glucan synthase
MLSQFGKTIKQALKSTEEERALLRARSAVQRFPVVEWRQRTEDFHKRSIGMSRNLAGPNAWRPSDGGELPHHQPISEHDDWNPVYQPEPEQPDWDRSSMMSSMRGPGTPGTPGPMTPGSPGQWSDMPSPDQRLMAPPRMNRDGSRASFSTDVSDQEPDYFSSPRGSMDTRQQEYSGFLDKANRAIGRDQRHAPDPFLDASGPSRPFGQHHRVSSVESIASIVDEKSNSPLNKAIASVRFSTYTDS